MKTNKIFTITILFFLFLILFVFAKAPSVIKAQDEASEQTLYEKAFADYQKQIQEYQVAHDEYILRRTQYLRFRTLQSQQDARDATVKMMQERDDVVTSYLTALKERLSEADGVDDPTKVSLNIRIDNEIGWFKDHKAKIPSAGSLEDLAVDSKRAKERYNQADYIFYETLSNISEGKVADFEERLLDKFNQLKTKISKIKEETREEYQLSGEQLTILDRWILEAENRISRSQDKRAEANRLISTFNSQRGRASPVYSIVIQRLIESQQFLKEAGNYLTEIVRVIKTKD